MLYRMELERNTPTKSKTRGCRERCAFMYGETTTMAATHANGKGHEDTKRRNAEK